MTSLICRIYKKVKLIEIESRMVVAGVWWQGNGEGVIGKGG